MQIFLGWARLMKHFDLPGHHATHEEMVAGVAKVIRAYLYDDIPANIGKLSASEFAGHLRRLLSKEPALIRELQIAGDLTFLEYAPALSNEKHIWDGVFQAGTNQIFDLMVHYDAELAWELMREDGFQLDFSNEGTPHHDAPILKVMDLLNTPEDRNRFCALVERARRLPPDLSWPLYLHKNATHELQAVLLQRQSLYNAFTPRQYHSAEYRYIHNTVYEACLSLGLKGRLPASEALFARVNRALKEPTEAQYPWLLTGDHEKLLECLMDMEQTILDKHFNYILADRFPIQGSYVAGATQMKMAFSKAGIAAAIDAFEPSFWQKVIDAELGRLQFQERLGLLDIAARRAPEYFIQAFNAESASFQIDITIGLVGMLTEYPSRKSEEIVSFRLGAGLLQIHRGAFESIDTSMTFEFGHLSTDPLMINLVTTMLEQMINREGSEYDVSSFPDSNIVFFLVNDLLSQEDVRIAMKMKCVQEAVAGVRLPKAVMQKMTPTQRDLVLGSDLGL